MSKLVRAALEAAVAIIATLAVVIAAFSTLFGIGHLIALSGVYYAIWATIVLTIHLVFATRRRHYRLNLSVGAGVIVMAAHLVMFLTGNVPVELNVVPVILHDFGFALVALLVLNIVHLVLFRRRYPKRAAGLAAPLPADRVDDIPAPVMSAGSTALALDDPAEFNTAQHAKSA